MPNQKTPTKINLTAPLNSLGYGGVSLNIATALDRNGVEVSLWPIGPQEVPQTARAAITKQIVNTQHYDKNAPSLRIFHQFDLAQHVGKGIHAAMPIFELNEFTAVEKHHLSQQDLILAPSSWARDILIAAGVPSDKVIVTPLGVDAELFHPYDHPKQVQDTVFINVGKWEWRKGHDFVIDSFERAFSPNDGVRLVMLCHNPCFPDRDSMTKYNDEWIRRYEESPMRHRITIYKSRLASQHHVADLMAQCDCGYFPSRAEGWNMELAEMLCMGKTCIATNYSAHTEYCSQDNCNLITIDELEPAHDGIWFHGQGEWASLGSNQMEQAVSLLRKVHRDKSGGNNIANYSGTATMKKYSWEETARAVENALCQKIS